MQRLITIDLRGADTALFETYESKVLPLLARYGARLELRVRDVDGASETHLLNFPDLQAYEAFRRDPDREAAQGDWRSCRASASTIEVETFAPITSTPGPTMIDRAWAISFAHAWIDAWNTSSLDQILSHYTDEATMTSPLIYERVGIKSGRLEGKKAIGDYWSIGLAAKPPLRFELLDVLSGVDAVALYYLNVVRGRRVVERLRFNTEGLVVEAEALYQSVG